MTVTGTSSKQGFQAQEREEGGSGAGGGFHFGGEPAEPRFQGGEGESELDLIPAIAQGCVEGDDEHGGLGRGGLEETGAVFVAEQDGFQFLERRGMAAPFSGEQLGDLLEKGVFNRAQILVGRAGPAGTAHQAVGEGQGERDGDLQDGNAAPRLGFEEGQVGRIGPAFREGLIGEQLQAGQGEGEIGAEEKGEARGEGRGEGLVVQTGFAHMARRK